jgi:nucleotide-binding universal stress UspA family protein
MLRWMSDRLTARPDDARKARECVVVAITGAASSDAVVRRAARLARRSRARLIGVTVAATTASTDPDTPVSAALVRDVGGTFHRIQGHDVAASLVEFAEAHGATQLVLGTSARTRLDEWRRGSVIDRVLRSAGRIDVHVISTPISGRRHRSPLATASPLGPRRQLLGFAVAALALLLMTVLLMTVLLVQVRTTVGESTSLAVYLLVVVAVSAIGGLAPGLSAAVMAPLLANWFLIAPYHTFRIAELAGPVGSDPLDRIVDHLRTSFSLDGVARPPRERGHRPRAPCGARRGVAHRRRTTRVREPRLHPPCPLTWSHSLTWSRPQNWARSLQLRGTELPTSRRRWRALRAGAPRDSGAHPSVLRRSCRQRLHWPRSLWPATP